MPRCKTIVLTPKPLLTRRSFLALLVRPLQVQTAKLNLVDPTSLTTSLDRLTLESTARVSELVETSDRVKEEKAAWAKKLDERKVDMGKLQYQQELINKERLDVEAEQGQHSQSVLHPAHAPPLFVFSVQLLSADPALNAALVKPPSDSSSVPPALRDAAELSVMQQKHSSLRSVKSELEEAQHRLTAEWKAHFDATKAELKKHQKAAEKLQEAIETDKAKVEKKRKKITKKVVAKGVSERNNAR
jgi:uncharacterized protein YukE